MASTALRTALVVPAMLLTAALAPTAHAAEPPTSSAPAVDAEPTFPGDPRFPVCGNDYVCVWEKVGGGGARYDQKDHHTNQNVCYNVIGKGKLPNPARAVSNQTNKRVWFYEGTGCNPKTNNFYLNPHYYSENAGNLSIRSFLIPAGR
ncbi:peptidase inhibitor family I36 protein [Saccharothrix australiensis]|uniref:Peptidase inhibitor family I36 n=1 Tax=Saccharothrix australiensis TaxID=2072 RepID=A0A495VTL8_9PSEU|nr:peptidase inhibitor family I36 protein [Saccharothrix australiensis]RKT51755.1 peptidase inhibitor family I36 [Saccharothrix australiensis]